MLFGESFSQISKGIKENVRMKKFIFKQRHLNLYFLGSSHPKDSRARSSDSSVFFSGPIAKAPNE